MIEERTRTMKEVVGGTQSPSGREGSKDKAFPEASMGHHALCPPLTQIGKPLCIGLFRAKVISQGIVTPT